MRAMPENSLLFASLLSPTTGSPGLAGLCVQARRLELFFLITTTDETSLLSLTNTTAPSWLDTQVLSQLNQQPLDDNLSEQLQSPLAHLRSPSQDPLASNGQSKPRQLTENSQQHSNPVAFQHANTVRKKPKVSDVTAPNPLPAHATTDKPKRRNIATNHIAPDHITAEQSSDYIRQRLSQAGVGEAWHSAFNSHHLIETNKAQTGAIDIEPPLSQTRDNSQRNSQDKQQAPEAMTLLHQQLGQLSGNHSQQHLSAPPCQKTTTSVSDVPTTAPTSPRISSSTPNMANTTDHQLSTDHFAGRDQGGFRGLANRAMAQLHDQSPKLDQQQQAQQKQYNQLHQSHLSTGGNTSAAVHQKSASEMASQTGGQRLNLDKKNGMEQNHQLIGQNNTNEVNSQESLIPHPTAQTTRVPPSSLSLNELTRLLGEEARRAGIDIDNLTGIGP